jgi:hypothetical protein
VATPPPPQVTVQVDGSGQLSTTQPVAGHATEHPLSGQATVQRSEVAQLTSQLAAALHVTSQLGAPLQATLQSAPLPQVRAQSLSAEHTHESPAQASSVQAVSATGTAAAMQRAASRLGMVFTGSSPGRSAPSYGAPSADHDITATSPAPCRLEMPSAPQ